MKTTLRLDKMLGNLGYGTRSEIKILIRQGAVTVNGLPVKDHGKQINPLQDSVTLDGEVIHYRDTVYLLLHKPAGVVSATEDSKDRTVIDLIDPEFVVLNPFPVGRLDKDTEGLLLITNDGKLSHELLSPRKHVPKTYQALVAGDVNSSDIEIFLDGVVLDDGYKAMPAQLRILAVTRDSGLTVEGEEALTAQLKERLAVASKQILSLSSYSWIEVTIHEGKFHQVKRMFEAVDKSVVYLRRISMGPLALDPQLAPGQWRELTEEEVDSLRNYRREATE